MNIYFYNSYQLSPVGFQLSKFDTDTDQLEQIKEDEFPSEAFHSLMVNSGAACVIGAADGLHYLVVHNISLTDDEDRQWYITLGVAAEQTEHEPFAQLAQKLLLDYPGFLSNIRNWFYATPEQSLSYKINGESLRNWLSLPVPVLTEVPFYCTQNPVVSQYRTMLEALAQSSNRRLFLLVPESTVSYFYSQNKVLDRELPHFLFNPEEFRKLLHRDATVLDAKKTEEKVVSTPIWEQFGITKEQFIQYVITGVIVCASFIGMVRHWVKKAAKHR